MSASTPNSAAASPTELIPKSVGDWVALRDVLADALPVHLFWKNREGRFLYANRRFCDSLGKSVEEIRGKRDQDFYPDRLAEKYHQDDMRVMETGVEYFDVEEHLAPGGQRVYVEVRKTPIRNGRGEIIGVQGAFRDVTEHRRTQTALYDAEARYYSLVESLPLATWSKDREGRFTFCNAQFCRTVGRPLHDLVGKTDFDVFPEELASKYKRDDAAVRDSGQVLECIEQFVDDKQMEHFLQVFKAPLFNARREVVGTQGVFWDVTEQEQAKRELRDAKEAAEEASRAKGQFVANMSHEIRTPLHGVMGMTELLRETQLTPQQSEYVGLISGSADALLTVINDVLDFSRIEAGKLALDVRPFHFRESLHQMLRLLALRAEDRGLELACRIAPNVPEALTGDPDRLRQIVFNLVGNAIKFTESGEVVVSAELKSRADDHAEIEITVRDTGIGIPKDKQDLVFHVFEQADGSVTRRFGGAGLGLAISARLVEMMHGKIQVESEPNQGSTFRFTAQFGVSAEDQSEALVAGDLAGARVLVADDNETSLAALCESFAAWGAEPMQARSCSETLLVARNAAAEGRPVRVAVVDWSLPDGDGRALAAQLHDDPHLGDLAVILIGSPNQAKEANAAGEICLAKPVNPSALFDMLPSALGGRRPVRAIRSSGATMPAARRPLEVLLAEDALVNQKLATGILSKRGHHVTVAADGGAAIEAWRRGKFDVILMDVQMPDVDGLTAAKTIRQEEGDGRRTPIIAMTAHAMPQDRRRCLDAGMDDYLSKPVRPDALIEYVERYGDADSADEPPRTVQREDEDVSAEASESDVEVDWEFALGQAAGDEDLLRDVVELYLQESLKHIAELEAAIADADAKTAERASHTLKSTSRYVGACGVSNLAAELEKMSANDQLSEAARLLAKFRNAHSSVVHALQLRIAA